jgi:hypothetical protein
MMLAFLTVGAQLLPQYVVPFMLMMTAGSAIMMTLTHYATGTSPIIFGSGYVSMGKWWGVGLVMAVVELLVFATVGWRGGRCWDTGRMLAGRPRASRVVQIIPIITFDVTNVCRYYSHDRIIQMRRH